MSIYNKSLSNETITINKLLSKQISGDWGKDSSSGNNNKKVKCIRGADIPDAKLCKCENLPLRYITEKNYNERTLQNYDIVIELSGGSPTQSTGRSCIVVNEDKNIICSNFCRALRFNKTQNAIFAYLVLNNWYNNKLFFNYEIGTTGIKNLNLDAILNLDIKLLTDNELIKIKNDFDTIYRCINKNANLIYKLTELKQLYLKKFFG